MSQNVNFTHIRLYTGDGSLSVNGGETLAHKVVGDQFYLARARVNPNDRYTKSIGRNISLERLETLVDTKTSVPGKSIIVPVDEIASAIAAQYVSSPAQAMISGSLKDKVQDLVYREILDDTHNARENLFVAYTVSTYYESIFHGLHLVTFFPMGRKIGMSFEH